MKALLDLFKQVTQKEEFDTIKIGLASPGEDPFVVVRRSEKAGNHQLSYFQA